MPIFKFGKHSGKEFSSVDRSYLEWLIEQNKKDIKLYQDELDRRDLAEQGTLSMTEKIVQAGYRELAKKLHPDTGGSVKEFQELRASFEGLKEALEGLKPADGKGK